MRSFWTDANWLSTVARSTICSQLTNVQVKSKQATRRKWAQNKRSRPIEASPYEEWFFFVSLVNRVKFFGKNFAPLHADLHVCFAIKLSLISPQLTAVLLASNEWHSYHIVILQGLIYCGVSVTDIATACLRNRSISCWILRAAPEQKLERGRPLRIHSDGKVLTTYLLWRSTDFWALTLWACENRLLATLTSY